MKTRVNEDIVNVCIPGGLSRLQAFTLGLSKVASAIEVKSRIYEGGAICLRDA
jgi:hypothetical protein